jgi:hypothetical protein
MAHDFINLTIPSIEQVRFYLTKWSTLENYVLQENSLEKLFTKTYPRNNDIDDVLIKVCVLNDFYSTNIFSPFSVAKHIVSLDIDEYLDNDDLSVVNRVARVQMNGGKIKNFYSFATKYFSHHKPLVYPIYDSFVEKMLMHFRKQDNFYNFTRDDLKDFPKFSKILIGFRKYYKLDSFNLKQIDQYLWQVGKEYFPKKY